MTEIHGFCDEKFAAVREEFEKNFSERDDVGASFAATIEGEYVIDIWGGHRDAEKSLPWEEDTIVNVYSTTKTMTFLTSLMLADRGELDLSAPIASYWPEFAQGGKGDIPFSYILCHATGLAAFDPPMGEEIYDHDQAAANLAAQTPLWEPGSQSGYHAVTQGILIGEVVRRITGQTLGTWFRENVSGPVGADFHIGLAPEHFDRTADMLSDPNPPAAPEPEEASEAEQAHASQEDDDQKDDDVQIENDQQIEENIAIKVFTSMQLPDNAVNSPGWRQAELPAANGHGNARSVVRAQTAMANDGQAFGQTLLSKAGVARASEIQITSKDLVLGFPISFCMGYARGNSVLPLCPNPDAIWWAGAGGSSIGVDKSHRLCYSYVMNQMKAALVGDERGRSLSDALYASL